jgi:hypothetical protein
MHESCSI